MRHENVAPVALISFLFNKPEPGYQDPVDLLPIPTNLRTLV